MFYRGLAAAALAQASRRGRGWRHVRELRRSRRYLERRLEGGSDFVHMAVLLQAETARLARDFTRARVVYEQASQRARQPGFPYHAALAHERRASMLVAIRRETEAADAMKEALALYGEWGADGKVALLAGERGAPSL